jgi:Kdo2-lipid IVA lauroyltransferase/acyltransferase
MASSNLKARLVAAFAALLAGLPWGWTIGLGRRFGDLLWWLNVREARVARRNIALCFSELDRAAQQQLARAAVRQLGLSLFESLALFASPPRDWLARIHSVEGEDHFHAACNSGRGVMIAAPHLGCWELLNWWLSAHAPLSVLYRPPKSAWLEDFLIERRGKLGATSVRAEPKCVRILLKALKRGEVLGILPDQQPKAGEGEFAAFFGIQALTMSLFCKLAASSGAVVLLGYVVRADDGYRLVFEPAPEVAGDTVDAVARLNQVIESAARAHPEQYVWTYKRFSIRPNGEPSLYS